MLLTALAPSLGALRGSPRSNGGAKDAAAYAQGKSFPHLYQFNQAVVKGAKDAHPRLPQSEYFKGLLLG